MIQMLPLILGTVVGYYIGCQIGSALHKIAPLFRRMERNLEVVPGAHIRVAERVSARSLV